MTTEELNRAIKVVRSAVSEAGEELIKHYGNIEAETKSQTGDLSVDIVTKLDRQTEDLLADRLAKFDPSIGFRGEESGIRSESSTTWLVDPIDGTQHFVRGLPFCSTMVALIEDNQVILSVINDFVNRNTYWAIRGQGAYRNDDPIHVSTRPLSQALLSFEARLSDPASLASYIKLTELSGLISTVNCGFEFAAIASGKLDGRITVNPWGKDWDFAPGSLLVTEAGGVATNIGSTGYDYRNHDYVIANAVVHKQLTEDDGAIFPLQK